ncbi:DUF1904 family protein [Cohnella pontilimi]|uniref:DUF1904 family protein n=1 Tax=Cohnella pontilimi TaxID=2564100 RepID=A0A4U0FD57_9BACL|nr:DUF1904 family protein [Cohnella pontilimi]
MPHLLIRGLSVEQVRQISSPLVNELSELCGCPSDHFVLECLHTTAVFDGEIAASYPFVEVAWFERGSEVRGRFAKIVDRHVRALGVPEAEIAFRTYREDAYYINGEPAGAGEEDLQQQMQTLRDTNARLLSQLQKARKASASDSSMSSRLRDALRE